MTMPSSALHVYDREIHGSERTSLSVLSAHIPPGARVLDLGCGSGAVGRFLTRRGDGAVIDGLTLNTEEAALAAPDYRRVEVANLDSADLAALFAGSQYDAIVCADVLEHTRHPQQVLASARRLLAGNGRVLISIPNAGYCGLIAELMAGEFRYRREPGVGAAGREPFQGFKRVIQVEAYQAHVVPVRRQGFAREHLGGPGRAGLH